MEFLQNYWAENKYPQSVTHMLIYNIRSRPPVYWSKKTLSIKDLLFSTWYIPIWEKFAKKETKKSCYPLGWKKPAWCHSMLVCRDKQDVFTWMFQFGSDVGFHIPSPNHSCFGLDWVLQVQSNISSFFWKMLKQIKCPKKAQMKFPGNKANAPQLEAGVQILGPAYSPFRVNHP